jgi:hypothetical protein
MNLYLTKEQLDAVVLAIDYYTEENDSHFIEQTPTDKLLLNLWSYLKDIQEDGLDKGDIPVFKERR